MSQVNNEKLVALKNTIVAEMADQEFLKKMSEADSPEVIRALLAEKGIEVTAEEIGQIIGDGHVFGEKIVGADGELDMEALDQVAGGGPVGGVILGGIFLIGGIANRSGWKRTLVAAGAAFAIGCMAPCA